MERKVSQEKAAQVLQLEREYIFMHLQSLYTCVGDKETDCITFCTGDIQAKDTKISELQLQLKNNEGKLTCTCIGVCVHIYTW